MGKAELQPKACRWCGKEFTPEFANKLYCSPECVKAKKNERTKRWRICGPKERTCPVCGKGFKTQGNGPKYCSPECEQLSNHRVPIGEPRVCPSCGKEFITKATNHRYCSEECKAYARVINKSARSKAAKAPRTCCVCGKVFTPETWGGTKYCSDECRGKVRYVQGNGSLYGYQLKKKPRKTKVCRICGKEFQLEAPGEQFCSNECRKHHYLRGHCESQSGTSQAGKP